MQIDLDPSAGFCFGVTRAIDKAEEELSKGPLSVLGDIVHNGQEVERLERLGLQTIQTLPNEPTRVLLRAHGEPPQTYQEAAQKELH